VGGSASLALHGLPIDPRDVDVLADQVAVAELVDGLQEAVVMDQAPWDRGDVRAARRVVAVVEGVEVEILVGVEAVGSDGDVVMTTPSLDRVEPVVLNGRPIPVLPLSTMRAVLEATGRQERAAMVRGAMGQEPPEQPSCRGPQALALGPDRAASRAHKVTDSTTAPQARMLGDPERVARS
jgi:hypothetical protein